LKKRKKKQKTFVRWFTRALRSARAVGTKFFGSFFQKRTACFASSAAVWRFKVRAFMRRA
jgi:hypothetical protein